MRHRVLAVALVTSLLASSVAACGRTDEAAQTLAAFLAGWSGGELDQVPYVTATGETIPAAEVVEAINQLSAELGEQPPQLSAGELTRGDGTASADVSVAWALPGGGTWSYATTVRLTERDDDWAVTWEPALVHPELLPGDELRLRRQVADRAAILDGAGDPLVTAQPVRVIGVWPSRVEDIDDLSGRLGQALASLGHDVDLSDLPDRVDAATEQDLFVPVITLREIEYQEIVDQLRAVPGVLSQQQELQLAPTRTFARALLGTVGEVFAEDVDRNPGTYVPGDVIGRGGLQERYEQRLRGTLGYTVMIARPAAGDAPSEDIELDRIEPVPGEPLATTLDQQTQTLAEQALSADSRPAALVAIRISDGAVLAVANTEGAEAHPVNLALTGSVAPGSTFKLVAAYRLFATGEVGPDTPVACPASVTVDGFTIRNSFSGDRGEIPFQQAMAISCNTAFAELAPRLGERGLAEAGAALGLGGDWDLGIDAFTGSVPVGGSALQQAVAAFGQGETQVSPVAMAAAVAAVARGAWLPPTLVIDPEQPATEPVPLAGPAVEDLHAALRAVVTDGTASALADVPGGEVYGKTGSAEAGEQTHAWFVGWQDDLAFAVFVEDGDSGAGAAVPLAERFLRALTG